MLMKTAPHSANLATMHDLKNNRLPCQAVMYHFFQLSMGWALEKKLKKLLIISTIILYIQPLNQIQIMLNVCVKV